VPVGLSSVVGFGSGGGAFILAIVAYLTGDRSTETLAALGTGAALLATTVFGRMLQAAAALRAGLTAQEAEARHRTGTPVQSDWVSQPRPT
jgi:hypothetical protein